MDTLQLNTYLHLIEALLQCAKGEEWLLLQQHEELIDAELIAVMEQVTEQLNTEGNAAAAKFLNYWAAQINHLLQQNSSTETSAENRSHNYLNLIQTLLECEKGNEVAILSQHPDLVDRGLVHTMNQVAAQLAAKGNQDTAIYLKHLAAEVDRVLLHPSEQPTPISVPPTDSQIESPAHQEVAITNNLSEQQTQCSIKQVAPTVLKDPLLKSVLATNNHVNGSKIDPAATTNKQQPNPVKSPPSNNQIADLLEKISHQLEQLEISINKHQNPANPLWYMSILEQADAQGWIVSSEEVEQLIGVKPHCAPDRNSFIRGCWKFEKAGKVGIHSSWRVTKQAAILPIVVETAVAVQDSLTPTILPNQHRTSEPNSTELELDLSSPWAENNDN